uniref:protocadherin beta-15-like n=1 Tax=Epinephelus lanceolatus TaxID=310571 RepID=UPI001446E2FE|nr:protocadherin beta-15-like [Epinephelus lanceolatus]
MVGGQIRYSIPEEMKKGSVIGNVAQDLGLDLRRLRSGRARIVTGENIHYTELKTDKGILVVNERIDREQLCGDVTPCSFSFELQLVVKAQDGGSPPLSSNVSVKILIQDQNDNPPQVLYPVQTGGSVVAEMVPRSADVGYLVTKVVAVDVDSGQNAWLSYKLQKATDRALFEVGLQNGEIRTIRQVTDKDAVKQRLSVIVEDNGQPSRSATVIVNVAVADSFPEVLSEFTDFAHDKEYNDNLTFYLVLALAVVSFLFITCLVVIISVKIYRWRQSRILYHSSLPVIPYYPPRYSDTLGTGTLQHVYNYEVCRTTDSRKSDCKFGRAGSQNVLIMDPSSTGTMQRLQSDKSILDEPDSPLEDLGIDMQRLRSGRARIVTGESIQYTELKTDKGTLVVNERIDREQLCGDHDMQLTIGESAAPGARFVLPTANDPDVGVNGLQDYHLSPNENFILKQHSNSDVRKRAEMVLEKPLDRERYPSLSLKLIAVDGGTPQKSGGFPVSEYVSVSADNGVIHAVRSFDYEQIKQLVFLVKAQDGGSPPLSSNVSVKILIQDQNDNPPQVLYPVQTGGSVVAEMVPRSADVGYLVTKVVAVDVDSGQNAWLSYKLQKATDRALFEVGLQNGEIRTIRQVTDKDAVKQRLSVIVEDNGQPSRSATVIVNVAVADSFPEVLSEFTDFAHDKEYNDNLTFYLVLALAVVSFLFITCLVVIISVKIYRWRQSRILYHSSLPVIPYYPPRYSDTLGTGTLQHVYNYEVCRTTDSRKSDCKFGRAGSQNVLIMDPSSTGTMQRIQTDKSILDEPDSPLEVRCN